MLSVKKNLQYLVVNCSKLVRHVRKKVFPRVRAAVIYRQLEGITTGYGAVAVGRYISLK